MLWIPPSEGGCVTSFKVVAKDTATSRVAGEQDSSDQLRVSFSGLTSGATYEFTVTPSGPGGGGQSASAKAAMPPAFLYVTPDAPEVLTAAATGETSVQLKWAAPAGNPKVDSYAIQIVPVNATG